MKDDVLSLMSSSLALYAETNLELLARKMLANSKSELDELKGFEDYLDQLHRSIREIPSLVAGPCRR